MTADPWTEEVPTGPLRITEDPPTIPDRRPMDHKTQPRKKDKGPIPVRQGNGYYGDHETGDRLRSVTTIIEGGAPKKGLIFWAANTCTESAIENLPALVAAARFPDQLDEMRRWIRKAHTRKKDERAEVGSAVHTIIESRILGTPPPSAVVVTKDGVEETWDLDGPELAPFVANFLDFEKTWRPEWTASEMVVANADHGYAGTLDYLIAAKGPIGDALRALGYTVDPDGHIMGDTKTGGDWVEVDGVWAPKLTTAGHIHGVYPEAGLQMSAYRNAKVCWLRSGDRVPMPSAAEVGVVLHLRPEGYRLFPARCGDREYAYFRHVQMVDEWSSRIASAKADDPVIGDALIAPTTPTTKES